MVLKTYQLSTLNINLIFSLELQMKTYVFRVFAFFLLTYSLAFTAVSAQDITAEHFEAARDAVISSGSMDSLDEILPRIADDAKTLFIRSNPSSAEEINLITDEVALELVGRRVELDRKIINIWAEQFSIAELNEIEGFFTSEVGLKLNEVTGEINFRTFEAAEHWQEDLSAELYQIVRGRLIEQGLIEQ